MMVMINPAINPLMAPEPISPRTRSDFAERGAQIAFVAGRAPYRR